MIRIVAQNRSEPLSRGHRHRAWQIRRRKISGRRSGVAGAIGVNIEGPRSALDDFLGNHDLFDALEARQIEHRVERSEEHTSELQSQFHLVCRLLLEKKKK